MARIFISYSSQDGDFVDKLANDLKDIGFYVWRDKWEIKVGDDIFDKIQHGLKNCYFVTLVLSQNSVSSGWVDKEWKIAYWNEINSRNVKLLPVLLEDCEIPEFLKLKKYADFRKNYDKGFKELMISINSADLTTTRKEDSPKTTRDFPKVQLVQKKEKPIEEIGVNIEDGIKKLSRDSGINEEQLRCVFNFEKDDLRLMTTVEGENEAEKQFKATVCILTAYHYCYDRDEIKSQELRKKLEWLGIKSLLNLSKNLANYEPLLIPKGKTRSPDSGYKITLPGIKEGLKIIHNIGSLYTPANHE